MGRMRYIANAAALVILSGLMACGSLSEQEAVAAITEIDQMEAEGKLTPEQATVLREFIRGETGMSFTDVLTYVGEIGLAVLLSVLGINKIRGPIKPMDRPTVDALRAIAKRETDSTHP